MYTTLTEEITGAYNMKGAKLTHYDDLSFRLILGVYPDTGKEFLLKSENRKLPLRLIADLKKETETVSTFRVEGSTFQLYRVPADNEAIITILY
jgi:hypothetical protein